MITSASPETQRKLVLSLELKDNPPWAEQWQTSLFYSLAPKFHRMFNTIWEALENSQQAYDAMVDHFTTDAEQNLPHYIEEFLQEARIIPKPTAARPATRRDAAILSFREYLKMD